jgi:peptidyl-prolyl cis-trans isomerase B (cyclophilin B)
MRKTSCAADAKNRWKNPSKNNFLRRKKMATEIKAQMQTNKGTIQLCLFAEQAPITVANFVNLSKRGYYNGLNFHRVIADFMVQGGCPEGTGSGGPGYRFEDECVPTLKHDSPGVLSMANSGPGTNGSQFFITHVPTEWLDGKHTVFGKVISDADIAIINSIQQGDSIVEITIEGDTESLLKDNAERVAEWNAVLDKKA